MMNVLWARLFIVVAVVVEYGDALRCIALHSETVRQHALRKGVLEVEHLSCRCL